MPTFSNSPNRCKTISSNSASQSGKTIYGSPCPDVIKGTRLDDDISGHQQRDHLRGRKGDDTLKSGSGRDTILGGHGSDQLRGGSGNDVLRGGSGQDNLRGSKGHDNLRGGRGTDILKGRRGNDVLHGGHKADYFYLSNGNDKIIDFQPNKGDKIISKTRYTLSKSERNGSVLLQDLDEGLNTLIQGTTVNALIAFQPELF